MRIKYYKEENGRCLTAGGWLVCERYTRLRSAADLWFRRHPLLLQFAQEQLAVRPDEQVQTAPEEILGSTITRAELLLSLVLHHPASLAVIVEKAQARPCQRGRPVVVHGLNWQMIPGLKGKESFAQRPSLGKPQKVISK